MRANPLWDIWRGGGTVLNGWVSVSSGYYAEAIAHQGWHSVTVDMQHGAVDHAGALETLTAISTTSATPLVRAAWLEPSTLMRALDAGAYGVICPMINSVEDAETLVAATSYPPKGFRSHGPMRGLLYGGSDYPAHANDTIARFAMIETRGGLENVRAIARVPGLSGLYVGPSDLANALGCSPKPVPTDPVVIKAIEEIVKAAQDGGIVPGIHCGTVEHAKEMIELGYRFVSVSTDIRLIQGVCRTIVDGLLPAARPK
jgi:4-hydroxy-2-oxoheptanedioate aldolase